MARANPPPADVPQVRVSYGDLDLGSAQDARTLYRRIVTAARHVCPPDGGIDLRLAAAGRRCVRDAVSRAVREVDSPLLAEMEAANAHRRKLG